MSNIALAGNMKKDISKSPRVVHTETINLSAESNNTIKGKKEAANVMVNLIRQQRSLYTKNIAEWLAARQAAEMVDFPQRTRLYDLYDDILLDEFVHGQIYNHRILPVKNRSFKVVDKNGVKNDERTKLLQSRWFDKFIQYALESKFMGYSLVYLKEFQLNGSINEVKKVELVPRRHVLQEKGFILSWESDTLGHKYADEPYSNFFIPIGEPLDLGLLVKAAPLWIIKKHAWQNWDEFSEIFGIPIRVIKTASQDKKVIAEIEDWAREMGSAAYGVFPADTEIDIKENSKTDAFRVFFEMIKTANEGLAVLFSGQTMTSMDGSSRSQAEVHQDVAEEIRKDDEKFITYEVTELIALLKKHGYPFEDGDRFEWDVPEDVKGLLEVFKAVDEMGFELDPKEVSTRLGIKVLGRKAAPAPIVPEKEDKPGKEDKPDKENLTAKGILSLHADIAKLYHGEHHVS
jgi:hypothetical protein